MSSPDADRPFPLSAARTGSPEALGELLEACRAYLLAIAERELNISLRAKGGASDLVQETLMDAQRDFPAFHGESEPELLGWLRRILLNNVHDFGRQFRGTDKRQINREVQFDQNSSLGVTLPFVADGPTPSQIVSDDEEVEALRSAIERLPEDYRQVLILRYIDGLSFEDIAVRMERTNNAVRQIWVRAVKCLREEHGAK